MECADYAKIGVRLAAGLKKLQDDCGQVNLNGFGGHCELGAMAFEQLHDQISCRTLGLADLVSSVLQHALPQDPTVWVSPRWADKGLVKPFIDQAVLNAYAIMMVHERLSVMESGIRVSMHTPRGTPVTLYSTDQKAVAHGVIALDHPSNYLAVNLTPTRALMTVTTVIVPGYLLPCSFCPSHQETALSAFGQPPFNIVCSAHHLFTRAPDSSAMPAGSSVVDTSSSNSESIVPSEPISVSEAISAQQKALLDSGDPGLLATADADLDKSVCSHADGELDPENANEDDDMPPEQDETKAECDTAMEQFLCELALLYEEIDLKSLVWILSWLQGDPFHLSHQLNIPVHHGLRCPFLRALSAAMFIMDPIDKAAVEVVLQKQGTSLDAKLRNSPKWALQRIHRHLPAPAIMLPRVIAVFNVYGPMKDSATGQPLFGPRTWETVKNILENIRLGYYSDSPGVPLYYNMGVDSTGLTLY